MKGQQRLWGVMILLALLSGCFSPPPGQTDAAFLAVSKARALSEYQLRTGKTASLRFDRQEGNVYVFAFGDNQQSHFATSGWLKVDDKGRIWTYDVASDEWQPE